MILLGKKNYISIFSLNGSMCLARGPKLVNIKVFVHVLYSTNENIPLQLPCYCIATNFHVYFAITTIPIKGALTCVNTPLNKSKLERVESQIYIHLSQKNLENFYSTIFAKILKWLIVSIEEKIMSLCESDYLPFKINNIIKLWQMIWL